MEQEFNFMKEVKVEEPKKTDIFFEGYFKDKPRPDYNSKEVKMLVVDSIFEYILGWLDEDQDRREEGSEEDSIREELMEVISYHKDGYEMAKHLEDYHSWSSDSSLVDILDGLSFYDSRKKLVIKWIKDNDFKPKFSINQEVVVSSKLLQSRYRNKDSYKGIVIKVDEDGTYRIKIEELGAIDNCGNYVVILDCDKVEKVEKVEKQA